MDGPRRNFFFFFSLTGKAKEAKGEKKMKNFALVKVIYSCVKYSLYLGVA